MEIKPESKPESKPVQEKAAKSSPKPKYLAILANSNLEEGLNQAFNNGFVLQNVHQSQNQTVFILTKTEEK